MLDRCEHVLEEVGNVAEVSPWGPSIRHHCGDEPIADGNFM